MGNRYASLAERFGWGHRPGPDGCWLWTKSALPHGYGLIQHNKKRYLAHRVSWELANGPIPIGAIICHRCDVTACVNPDHLFLGTSKDNSSDMAAKGRSAHGSRNGQARLSSSRVAEIRTAVANGAVQRQIAKRLGMSPATISLIVNNKTWRHANGGI